MSAYAEPQDVRLDFRRGALFCFTEAVRIVDGARAFWIPAGFSCDLASIPAPARVWIDKTSLGFIPAAAHDLLYRSGGVVDGCVYTRAEADRLFLDLMAWEGVGWAKRWAAFAAVRAFGWTAWRPAFVPAL